MLRLAIPRRAAAAVATGVLAIGGAVVLAAPAAQAVELTWTSKCVNELVPQLPIDPSETKVDIKVSPVKDTYTVGDLITVTWDWLSYSKVPNAGLPSIPKDSTKPFGFLNMTGAQTGVATVEGPQINPEAPVGSDLVLSNMTGTFTLTAPGTVTLTPKGHRTVTTIGTIVAPTNCDPLGTPPGVAATLNVQDGQSTEPTLVTPTDTVYTGATFNMTGSNFAPNAPAQLSLCNADGSNCLSDRFTANTVAIDGAGKLTGTATVATTLADGNYVVRVVDGVKEARANLKVAKYVPTEPRKVVSDVSSGPLGTVMHLTGENWTSNRAINIAGINADGAALVPIVNVTSTPDGKFTAEYTISDPTTTQLRIREGTSSTNRVFVPFSIAAAGDTQSVDVNLAAGPLSMTQAGDGINFGTATLNGEAQTLNANLNQVTVTDARGGNLGWSLTGTMTDLVAANGTDKIQAGNISWTPACAALPGSLNEVATGTPGALGSTASTLCSVTATGGTTGGKFSADAQLKLTTPQFAAAGAYTGTLTLTLI